MINQRWEATDQQRLHPNTVWIFFYRSVLKGLSLAALPGVFLVISGMLSSWTSFLLFVFLVGFGFAYLWARLSYRAYGYQVTQYSFYKESGVVRKKPFTIPYEKIRNVSIHRGILERILGLSELRIRIAGSYRPRKHYGLFGTLITMSFSSSKRFRLEAEEELPGLSPEVAGQLSTELLVRKAGGG